MTTSRHTAAPMLTPAETAVVAGVSVRDVNRMIDESILPEAMYSVGADGARRFSADACPWIALYFHAADCLTSQERIRIIAESSDDAGNAALRRRSGFLTIDISSFVRESRKRLARLLEASTIVTEAPGILGGLPVVKGTRIPIHDLAASAAAGIAQERILAAYPGLTAGTLSLAILYAQANPPRGRRRRSGLPAGAVIVSSRRRPRRQAA